MMEFEYLTSESQEKPLDFQPKGKLFLNFSISNFKVFPFLLAEKLKDTMTDESSGAVSPRVEHATQKLNVDVENEFESDSSSSENSTTIINRITQHFQLHVPSDTKEKSKLEIAQIWIEIIAFPLSLLLNALLIFVIICTRKQNEKRNEIDFTKKQVRFAKNCISLPLPTPNQFQKSTAV